jgi:hypothetical protein
MMSLNPYRVSNQMQQVLTTKLSWIVATCILLICSSAYSSESNERQAEILQEVRETIKDDELAKQIVELRLKREAQKEATYISVGSHIAIGYSQKISEHLAVRTEVRGLNTPEQTKDVGNTNYHFQEKNFSLGAYLDWFPTESSFRLTGGVNINRMRTALKNSGSPVNINGSQVNLGSNVFDVEFKFPLITPYIGLGFGDRNAADEGMHFYGDFGLMLGKYDAVATTNVIGTQGVKASDVDAELNNLRKNLYKWNFIPAATVGLTYRFN